MDDFERRAAQAVEQFVRKVTVPILVDLPSDEAKQVGTGTLFRFQGRHFLITARHILEDEEPPRFAVPIKPDGPETLRLGPKRVFTTQDPQNMDIDIAVIELLDANVIATLAAGWTFLTAENTAVASKVGQFILCGYPAEKIQQRGKRLRGPLLMVYTGRLGSTPPNAGTPVDDSLDLFFRYQSSGFDDTGNPVPALKLQGLSGSSVWEHFSIEDGLLWSPQRALRVVGIQASYMPGAYARAKSWQAVAYILQNAK